MSIFNSRSFNVKMVKDKDLNGGVETDTRNPYEGVQVAAAYAEVAKDLITHAALIIGGVWAACKIVERICK
jgi:hypothetical protein